MTFPGRAYRYDGQWTLTEGTGDDAETHTVNGDFTINVFYYLPSAYGTTDYLNTSYIFFHGIIDDVVNWPFSLTGGNGPGFVDYLQDKHLYFSDSDDTRIGPRYDTPDTFPISQQYIDGHLSGWEFKDYMYRVVANSLFSDLYDNITLYDALYNVYDTDKDIQLTVSDPQGGTINETGDFGLSLFLDSAKARRIRPGWV